LVLKEKISYEELEQLVDERLLSRIPEINRAFRELDTDKLQPVFERFNGQYSFDELRLVRLFLAFNGV